MNAVVSALLWCVLQVTVLSCGAALVYLAARRIHPRAGAAAAGGALAMALVLTVLVASPWPRWTFSAVEQVAAGGATVSAVPSLPRASSGGDLAAVVEPPLEHSSPAADLDSPQLAFWNVMVEALNNPRPAPPAGEPAARWLLVIGGIFAVGALIAATRLAWGVMLVGRLARRGRPIDDARLAAIAAELRKKLQLDAPVALRESDELATPATVGWQRPVVLLPAAWRTWSDEELRAAVAHELAHVAGRDYAAWLVARLAVVAHFYHPLVRWLAARLQLEQELAADMAAARLMGDSRQYLHSLAALALATPPARVAGPARTLFPTRSLLVRRVEMLRTLGTDRPRRPIARYATFAIVALLALAVAGLRGPGSGTVNVARAQAPAAHEEEKAPAERLGLELVPEGAVFVVSVQSGRLIEDKRIKPVIEALKRTGPEEEWLISEEVDEVMTVGYGDLVQRGSYRTVYRFHTPAQLEQFLALCLQGLKAEKVLIGSEEYELFPGNMIPRQFDARTIVFDAIAGVVVDGQWQGPLPPLKHGPPVWQDTWKDYEKEAVVIAALDMERLRTAMAAQAPGQLAGGLPLQMVAPVIQQTEWAVAAVALKDQLHIDGILRCDSEESAKNVRDTLQALTVLLQNMARQQAAAIEQAPAVSPSQRAGIKLISEAAGEILASAELAVEGEQVHVALQSQRSTPEIVNLAMTLLPAIEEARQAARQQVSANNLKQLGLAMYLYESAHKRFPPASVHTYKVEGEERRSEHPHSWRVAILPYLGHSDLYEQYRFDEPWDSEANKQLLARIPGVFRSPHDDPNSTNTSYFVFTGPETIFHDDEGTRLSQITDGTSRTLLVVEAKRPVPWTKPEDIPYATDQPVPELGGWVPGEFLVALADGSVRRVSADVDEATLRGYITKAGREATGPLPRPGGN